MEVGRGWYVGVMGGLGLGQHVGKDKDGKGVGGHVVEGLECHGEVCT